MALPAGPVLRLGRRAGSPVQPGRPRCRSRAQLSFAWRLFHGALLRSGHAAPAALLPCRGQLTALVATPDAERNPRLAEAFPEPVAGLHADLMSQLLDRLAAQQPRERRRLTPQQFPV